jgi:hypothetical protein
VTRVLGRLAGAFAFAFDVGQPTWRRDLRHLGLQEALAR